MFTTIPRQVMRAARSGDQWPWIVIVLFAAIYFAIRVRADDSEQHDDWREIEPGHTTLSLSA